RLPGVVSVPSPASRYLVALGRAVARLSPGARIAVEAAPGRLARFACEELQRDVAVLRRRLVPKPTNADAVLYCGPPHSQPERSVELDATHPLAVARRLRTTTFFGGFELGPDGLQVGHHLSAVQWREGRRELLLADAV